MLFTLGAIVGLTFFYYFDYKEETVGAVSQPYAVVTPTSYVSIQVSTQARDYIKIHNPKNFQYQRDVASDLILNRDIPTSSVPVVIIKPFIEVRPYMDTSIGFVYLDTTLYNYLGTVSEFKFSYGDIGQIFTYPNLHDPNATNTPSVFVSSSMQIDQLMKIQNVNIEAYDDKGNVIASTTYPIFPHYCEQYRLSPDANVGSKQYNCNLN